jgi:hypothetical protein
MFRDAKTGMQHTIPLSTNFKLFKFFSVTAGSNYQETWTLNTIKKSFNTVTNKVETTDVKVLTHSAPITLIPALVLQFTVHLILR